VIEINVRRVLVYVATAIFFTVAAMAELQGDATMDAFLKAGVACVVTLTLGLPLVGIIDRGIQRGLLAAANADTSVRAAAPTLAMPRTPPATTAPGANSGDPGAAEADDVEAR